ncbi:MAG: transglutaminase domain-containing protein, partial [Bacteroidaceae bacterium]|nr:transglutaminase domain-containing protein [Bacteroidaceae bacterium]
VQVIGAFDSEIRYTPLGKSDVASILSTTGRGYYVIGFLKPGDEPTNHALRDMAAVKEKLEEWGRPIVLLSTDGVDLNRFLSRPEFQGLPSTVSFGAIDRALLDKAFAESRIPLTGDYPVFFIADTFNRVVWCSQGYTIGLGDQILKIAKKL